ncbi:hypothetical protein FBEOM_8672 [Fusarium beomiforme]|uniref:Uncharacterized protein n=1 Tax=Fusarium beomiforme TaxID=44412 RepID=A0A9P5AEZ4_9HYPO|nr:hypothetical protein FBEOM_8672 [Fusarium beomiforme]
MDVNEVPTASLKRQRSISVPADEMGPTKTLKGLGDDLMPHVPSLKRQRSSDADTLVDERDCKVPKLTKGNDHNEEGYGSDTDVEPEFEEPPETLEIDHIKVTKLKLVSIDEHGHEIHLPPASTQPTLGLGLLTPDPTPPLNKTKQADPFNDAVLDSEENIKNEQTTPPAKSLQAEVAHDSPANFAWVGDLKLFGLIPSKLYIYHHISDELHPYKEVVKISTFQELSLGTLMPSLKGTTWDMIRLQDTILGWRATSSNLATGVQQRGMYLETDVIFQGALQPVSDFFRDFFQQDQPALHMSVYMGSKRTYDKFDMPSDLTLRGSLRHLSLNILEILEFHEIGVELTAHQSYDIIEKKQQWHFGFGFFGKLNIAVPGTAVPLQVDYYLRKRHQSWFLVVRLRDEEWTDVFGCKNLKLTEVVMQARLGTQNPGIGSLSFEVEAQLELRKTMLAVRGFYSKNDYSIEVEVGNLTFNELGDIFKEFVGIDLEIFDYNVTLNSMRLRISKAGLELHGAVTIDNHTSAAATLVLSKDGIGITGLIGDVQFEDALIKEAQFDVFIASKIDTKCARSSRLSIGGDVCFSGVELKVGLFLDKSEDGNLKWAIYGEVEGDVSTSRLVPEVKNTFLDISLSRLALVASNHDAEAKSYPGIKYPIIRGFQFCAAIDGIHELEQLLRGSVKGMVLRAMYHSTSNTFGLSIMLPAARTITFSETVYSGPLEIEVEVGSDIQLLLKAILNIKVDTQPDPLQLSLGLKANKLAASAYAQMLNDWRNPCHLGEKVVIRKCALEFGIVYTTFFSTGTPGVIGLAGELSMGSKLVGVAMKVSQNPSEQLLTAQITDLGVADLVEFASLVADTHFPKPDDFIHINDAQLYLSTGTKLGLTDYPAGASLKGDLTIFGKNGKFECTIGSKVKVFVTTEAFQVGPLKVKGATGADPIIDVELSKDTQHVLIDGAVEIWDAAAAIHLEVSLLPKPILDFSVSLQLSDLFLLKLQAKLKGDINIKDIKSWANADFEVYALIEQHLIDHITSQLEQQIQAAQDAAKHGFDDIKKEMEEKEAAFKASCQEAIDSLERTRAKWNEKKAEIEGQMDSARQEATRIRIELQEKVDRAQQSFNSFVAERSADLERVRANAAAAIRDAEHDIDEAQRDSDSAIYEAQAKLQQVRADFMRDFGSAERDIESARHDVENAQRRVDELDRDIDWINRRIDDEPWYNCPPLIAEKAGLLAAQATATAGLQVVRGVFFAAEAVVHGTGFVTAEGAIGAAEVGLDGVRELKTAALNTAKDALEEVNAAQGRLIQEAIDALHAAQTASEELHVFDLARDALSSGESLAQGMINGAQQAVDGLSKCGEFIAFDASEAALRFAQSNTSELNLARHAVEVAEGAVNMGLDMGKWAMQHAGQIFNIRKMEFSGSIRSLVSADASSDPLIINIEGTVLGEDIQVHIQWKPNFNLVEFIKELFSVVWEKIKELAKHLIL